MINQGRVNVAKIEAVERSKGLLSFIAGLPSLPSRVVCFVLRRPEHAKGCMFSILELQLSGQAWRCLLIGLVSRSPGSGAHELA